MPEFELNADRFGSHPFYKLSLFAKGYVEAMFFTNGDTGDDRENLLNDLGIEKLTRDAVKDIAKDCNAFLSHIMPDGCFVQQWLDRANETTGYELEQGGRDFWFTRQRHGVGFWARRADELSPDIADGLSDVARKFGEAYVEVYRNWISHR